MCLRTFILTLSHTHIHIFVYFVTVLHNSTTYILAYLPPLNHISCDCFSSAFSLFFWLHLHTLTYGQGAQKCPIKDYYEIVIVLAEDTKL